MCRRLGARPPRPSSCYLWSIFASRPCLLSLLLCWDCGSEVRLQLLHDGGDVTGPTGTDTVRCRVDSGPDKDESRYTLSPQRWQRPCYALSVTMSRQWRSLCGGMLLVPDSRVNVRWTLRVISAAGVGAKEGRRRRVLSHAGPYAMYVYRSKVARGYEKSTRGGSKTVTARVDLSIDAAAKDMGSRSAPLLNSFLHAPCLSPMDGSDVVGVGRSPAASHRHSFGRNAETGSTARRKPEGNTTRRNRIVGVSLTLTEGSNRQTLSKMCFWAMWVSASSLS